MLTHLEAANLVGLCCRNLASAGLSVEQSEDLTEIQGFIARIDKPYLTEIMDPLKNDFFEPNSFWLLMRSEGVGVGCVGARFDDTGHETLRSYTGRKMRGLFPNAQPTDHRLPRHGADAIAGRVVYFGDLFVTQEARPADRNYLRVIMTLCYTLAWLKWQPDWVYSFLRASDAERGTATQYGFRHVYPWANSWTTSPDREQDEHYLCALSAGDLIEHIEGCVAHPRTLAVESKSPVVRLSPQPGTELVGR